MNRITEVRAAIAESFGHIDHDKKVLMSPTDLMPAQAGGTFGGGEKPDTNYVLRIMVGPASDEVERIIDDLVTDVASVIKQDRTLGGVVSVAQLKHCSGHRLYGGEPGNLPRLGCEWTIKVMD